MRRVTECLVLVLMVVLTMTGIGAGFVMGLSQANQQPRPSFYVLVFESGINPVVLACHIYTTEEDALKHLNDIDDPPYLAPGEEGTDWRVVGLWRLDSKDMIHIALHNVERKTIETRFEVEK